MRVPSSAVRLGLWRCTFNSAGETYPALVVFNVPQPVFAVVGDLVYAHEELCRAYPGASELHMMGKALLVSIATTLDEWDALGNDEKVALIYRTLDEHQAPS